MTLTSRPAAAMLTLAFSSQWYTDHVPDGVSADKSIRQPANNSPQPVNMPINMALPAPICGPAQVCTCVSGSWCFLEIESDIVHPGDKNCRCWGVFLVLNYLNWCTEAIDTRADWLEYLTIWCWKLNGLYTEPFNPLKPLYFEISCASSSVHISLKIQPDFRVSSEWERERKCFLEPELPREIQQRLKKKRKDQLRKLKSQTRDKWGRSGMSGNTTDHF